MKITHSLIIVCSLVLGMASTAAAEQGRVQFLQQGDRITVANDYVERVWLTTDGTLKSEQFTNRLAQRSYTLCGEEFEIDLSFARLKYDAENPVRLTSRDFKISTVETAETPSGGRRVLLHLELRRPISDETGLQATVVYELNPDDFYTRQWIELKATGKGTLFLDAVWPHVNHWSPGGFRLGGLGQPLLSDDLFLGLEYPSSINSAQDGEVKLGSRLGLNIPAEGFKSEAVVLGVAARGNAHAAFMDYVQQVRRAAPRPFILYNTWYDLPGVEMTSAKVLERIPILEKNLFERYPLRLDSFVLDDGWDDPQNLWRVDRQRFPGGFHDLVGALGENGSKLGIWFGPLGGYGGGPATNRSVRIATGRRQGMEISSNEDYFCLAGKNYSAYLRDSMLRLIRDYGVNYFKLDGIPFACSAPDHGHPVGIYSREAYVRSVIDLVKALDAANPQAFIGLATGPWLSPWWLRYADTVDYGGDDFAYLDAVPSLTPRQSALSYNDSVLYRNYAEKQVQFPMSSLDGEGIIKGTYNLLGGENEPLEDWQDTVVSFAGSGLMRADLYLSPSILKLQEWEALGRSLAYFEANAHPLLDNSTWVLGNPAAGEAYGFVHSGASKSIVMLRNPSLEPARVRLPLTSENGFVPFTQPQEAEVVFPFREVLAGEFRDSDTLAVTLDGFEQRVIEFRPRDAHHAAIEGVRYSVRAVDREGAHLAVFGEPGTSVPAYFPGDAGLAIVEVDGKKASQETAGVGGKLLLRFGEGKGGSIQPRFSEPSIRIGGTDEKGRDVQAVFAVQIPTDFENNQVGLLVQSPQALGDVKAELKVNGKAASPAIRKGERQFWYWCGIDLVAGSYRLELTLHLPAGHAPSPRVSGWLRTRHRLASRELVLKAGAGQGMNSATSDPLPASSGIERKTYRLFDEVLE